jgi:Transposase DDE domain
MNANAIDSENSVIVLSEPAPVIVTVPRTHKADMFSARTAGLLTRLVELRRMEEIFGWIKTIAGLRKTRHRGDRRVGWMFTFTAAAYNLVRMRNLAQTAT